MTGRSQHSRPCGYGSSRQRTSDASRTQKRPCRRAGQRRFVVPRGWRVVGGRGHGRPPTDQGVFAEDEGLEGFTGVDDGLGAGREGSEDRHASEGSDAAADDLLHTDEELEDDEDDRAEHDHDADRAPDRTDQIHSLQQGSAAVWDITAILTEKGFRRMDATATIHTIPSPYGQATA